MTREEIVKALRHCASANDCRECVLASLKVSTGRCERILQNAAADLLEQDANTKSRPSPIPIEDITGTTLVTPCWIEIKYGEGYTHITPDILDKDSTGYFGKLYGHEGGTRQYLYEKDYNRTWRCWRDFPGKETVNNSKWEEAQ
mgnify:CR=1 FL=1|nr:MAG TPA: hypothetical protein [Caudoviricetes sp.]